MLVLIPSKTRSFSCILAPGIEIQADYFSKAPSNVPSPTSAQYLFAPHASRDPKMPAKVCFFFSYRFQTSMTQNNLPQLR